MRRSRKRSRLPPGIRIRRLGGATGVRIWLVDGEKVRDRVCVDFTMGGSDARFRFIPRNEIWIERILSPRERRATICHEIAERRLMRGGMGYEPAHDRANIRERAFRRRTR